MNLCVRSHIPGVSKKKNERKSRKIFLVIKRCHDIRNPHIFGYQEKNLCYFINRYKNWYFTVHVIILSLFFLQHCLNVLYFLNVYDSFAFYSSHFSKEITHTYASLFEFNDLQSSINRHYFQILSFFLQNMYKLKKWNPLFLFQIVRKVVKDIAKRINNLSFTFSFKLNLK